MTANRSAIDSPWAGISRRSTSSARSDNMPQWYRRGVTAKPRKLNEIKGFRRLRQRHVPSDAPWRAQEEIQRRNDANVIAASVERLTDDGRPVARPRA